MAATNAVGGRGDDLSVLLPDVIPADGVDLASAIRVLRERATALSNLDGNTADHRLGSYHAWAVTASDMLGYVFPLESVDALIATSRHDVLIARATGYNERLVNGMITAEQTERGRTFAKLLEQLQQLQGACRALPQTVLVPDTNVFLHEEVYFHEIDWQKLADSEEDVRLLVPISVVRELDNAKRLRGKVVSQTNPEELRTRARVTLRRLRDMFSEPDAVAQLGPRVSIELLLDPLTHRRLDDPDSEILDRTLAAQSVSGRRITVVTGDGGMEFTAKIHGLRTVTSSPSSHPGQAPAR